jgi:hypothetical protein
MRDIKIRAQGDVTDVNEFFAFLAERFFFTNTGVRREPDTGMYRGYGTLVLPNKKEVY